MNINTHCYFDTIVIGGGTAGAAVAGRLAQRKNQSVLLLEAGPDYGFLSNGDWPNDLLNAQVISDTHSWGYISSSATGEPRHALQRARVIGGCSSHNGCIALWGSRLDYDRWKANGNIGWAMDDLLPFFEKASAMLRVREFTPDEVTPFHDACRDAMVHAGIKASENLNALDENIGAGIAPVNIQNGMRWNTSIAYLDPVRDEGYLTVMGDTLVDKILLVKGHAISVDAINSEGILNIRAGRIVLCAGAYNSPTVLLRSGIGSEDSLNRLNIPIQIELPGVGENLHDHPSINLKYMGSEFMSTLMKESVNSGAIIYTEQSLAKLTSDQCSEAFDLHIYPTTSPSENELGLWECTLSVANMAPKSRGRVTLNSAIPDENPVINPRYLSDPDGSDLSVLMEGIEVTRRIAKQTNFAELLDMELPESKALIDSQSVRRGCLHYFHPVGTCKMGPDSDPASVVDSYGKVYGTDNVFVADASIMPVIPRANTNVPTLMVAERIACYLENGVEGQVPGNGNLN